MITKVKLYFDTIKRIPLKQNFFLIKEKILKNILPLKLSTFEEVERKFYSKEVWPNFFKNSNELNNKENTKIFWDIGVSENQFQHHYHSFVKKILEEYKNAGDIKALKNLWEARHDDIEFIYNLQRMYKFSETMESLEFNNSQKINVLNSWIDNHPPQKGAAWMGFNCSIRLINWIKILISLDSMSSIKENDVKKIFISIFQNLEFISKNIEHHIPGNHVIFQYFSFWLICFLIEDRRTEEYSKYFIEEFENEFLASGLHFELSTHYHLQVLQLGVYHELIRKNTPNIYKEKINKAYSILDAFSFSENILPLIGDNCYNFFHNNLVEDAENLNSLRKLLDFSKIEDRKIIEIENQYLIVNKDKSKLIFDVGNIGMKQNPGHGHSDILSINYSYEGTPIFIDPGTKRYSNLQENLELKRANSHNTISINGEDQSKLWGFFRWAFLPDRTRYEYRELENSVVLEASFVGNKNTGGAQHCRKIEMSDSALIITDKVECINLNTIEQNFILSEFVTLDSQEKSIYLIIGSAKFELVVNSHEEYILEIVPQKIYKSYDNPTDSNKISIKYKSIKNKFESTIKLKLVNE